MYVNINKVLSVCVKVYKCVWGRYSEFFFFLNKAKWRAVLLSFSPKFNFNCDNRTIVEGMKPKKSICRLKVCYKIKSLPQWLGFIMAVGVFIIVVDYFLWA